MKQKLWERFKLKWRLLSANVTQYSMSKYVSMAACSADKSACARVPFRQIVSWNLDDFSSLRQENPQRERSEASGMFKFLDESHRSRSSLKFIVNVQGWERLGWTWNQKAESRVVFQGSIHKQLVEHAYFHQHLAINQHGCLPSLHFRSMRVIQAVSLSSIIGPSIPISIAFVRSCPKGLWTMVRISNFPQP